jgi:hypothetical protein
VEYIDLGRAAFFVIFGENGREISAWGAGGNSLSRLSV